MLREDRELAALFATRWANRSRRQQINIHGFIITMAREQYDSSSSPSKSGIETDPANFLPSLTSTRPETFGCQIY